MDADAYFWAGMAGGRANRIRKFKEANHEWEAHAQKLERTINELRTKYEKMNYIAKDWQEEAIEGFASSGVALKAFKEVTGKSVREHLGDEETDRRLAAERKEYKEHVGLKR